MHTSLVARRYRFWSCIDSNVLNSTSINRYICADVRALGNEDDRRSEACSKLWISVEMRVYTPVQFYQYTHRRAQPAKAFDGVKQSPERYVADICRNFWSRRHFVPAIRSGYNKWERSLCYSMFQSRPVLYVSEYPSGPRGDRGQRGGPVIHADRFENPIRAVNATYPRVHPSRISIIDRKSRSKMNRNVPLRFMQAGAKHIYARSIAFQLIIATIKVSQLE